MSTPPDASIGGFEIPLRIPTDDRLVFRITNPFFSEEANRDADRLSGLVARLDLSRLPFEMQATMIRDFVGMGIEIKFMVRDVRPEFHGAPLQLFFKSMLRMRHVDGSPISDDLVFAQIHDALLKLFRHELNECMFVDGRRFMPDDGAHA